MRWIILLLIFLLGLLQYKLWFENGGMQENKALLTEINTQQKQNDDLKKQNEQLRAEVKDLKQGVDAAEERARSELGMTKQNEDYYQVIQEKNQ